MAENRLGQQFDAVTKANEVWLSGITFIWTEAGWLYLAVILDLYTRKVVGWSVAERMMADLVVHALVEAVRSESLSQDELQQLTIHSDRGSQYASEAYQQMLKSLGMTCSMSRWDARRSLFEYIKVPVCFASFEKSDNRIRKHSALGYVSPAQYAQAT